MHLVFLNQYYPPDAAPTGVMLEAVAQELITQGHSVTILCAEGVGYATASAPSLSTTDHSPVRVVRIPASRFGRGSFIGKLADYLSYYLGVLWRLLILHPRPDRIIALTTPPYLSLLARIGSKLRRADHAHWVMDLYPDVMTAHGMLREGGLIHRLLAILARWGFGGRRCAALLTLGPDMAERIDLLTGSPHHAPTATWIPLWSGTDEESEPAATSVTTRRHSMGWTDNALVVMYSGNMGLGHRFGEILSVIPQFNTTSPQPVFAFFGAGKRRAEIASFLAQNQNLPVELHDYAPSDILPVHLRSADVHLASLAPEWTGTMVPSKLQGIFHAARPVIFIGDSRSSIGRWVIESGGGWVVPPGDLSALNQAIQEALDPSTRLNRGQAAKAFAQAHFQRTTNARKVADTFVR